MNKHQAAAMLRRTLLAERGMRERVFRNDSQKRQAKVAEIDRALEALATLCAAASIVDEEAQPQMGLFEQ